MKLRPFSTIDLPHHHEEEFSTVLLGVDHIKNHAEGKAIEGRNTKSGVKELLLRAHNDYFRGFYMDGLTGYARVLRQEEHHVDAWVGQIRILVDVGRYEAAVFWADEVIKRLGEIDVLRYAKAFALAYGGMVEEAKRIINVPVGPDEASYIWLLRGEVFLRIRINFLQRLFSPHKGIGKVGAFFCFLKALGSHQDDAFLNQRIGLAYLQSGDSRRGFEHLAASLNVVPDNPLTLYGFAECCRMNGDDERALYNVKKAIAGNPQLDCAFELLQRMHRPRLRNIMEFFGMKG
ncbi:MAG: tetratricopeptide repeat protein [candidate division WOR-3 bacterium]|nr:MAG: tetratricopeptide repeat protein [candidate division WOR-3 bacterium]